MHTPRINQEPVGFRPLRINECNCLIGFRSDASPQDLYDEAELRQLTVLSLLRALGGTSNLNALTRETLGGAIEGIRLLCGDANGLYSAAWDAINQEGD